jgi:3-phosphoglycerate kinase
VVWLIHFSTGGGAELFNLFAGDFLPGQRQAAREENLFTLPVGFSALQ